MDNITPLSAPYRVLLWLARIILGSTFVMSGFTKLIDLWGFVYKIEEYLGIWGIEQPRSIVFVVALLISGFEFVTGFLLALGCFKRTAPVFLLLLMAGLLPLTLYIYIADPVADCGCFGDFWKISNGATFWKNLFLTVLLCLLLIYNRRESGLYSPPVQWLVVTVVSAYALAVGLIGYYIQPLLDFRSFPIDTDLMKEYAEYDSSQDDDDPEFVFIYEDQEGNREEFLADNLPGDDWTFIDRRQIRGQEADGDGATDFVVLQGDEDVTEEAVKGEGREMLLLIPDLSRADVAYTYPLNELNAFMENNDGRLVALIADDSKGLAVWSDLSMASYPLYSAEPNLVKELGRGDMSLVYLEDGIIKWKRTLQSVDSDKLSAISSAEGSPDEVLESYDPMLSELLAEITIILVSALMVVWFLDRSGRLLSWKNKIRKKDASVEKE